MLKYISKLWALDQNGNYEKNFISISFTKEAKNKSKLMTFILGAHITYSPLT